MAEQAGLDIDRILGAASAALMGGRFAEAEESCRRVLASQPRHLPAMLLLGSVAAKTGRTPLAVNIHREALSIDPHSSDAINGLSFLLRTTGQFAEALSLCLQAIELNPRDITAYLNLGSCYMAQQSPVHAAETFEKALAIRPDLGVVHYNLGLALQEQDRILEAAECFRQAIVREPNVPEIHAKLGQVSLSLGDRDQAVACFRRSAQVASGPAGGGIQLAKLLIEEGMMEEAEEHLRRETAKNRHDPGLQAMLGDVLVYLGRFDEAIESFERAIALQPRMVIAYFGIIQVKKISETDRPFVERIAGMLREGNHPPMERAVLHNALGKAYNDLGEYASALRNFDQGKMIWLKYLEQSGGSFNREQYAASFDVIIKTFTKEFFERHRQVGSDSDLPILIFGMPRSGTTLLEQIVSSHPKVGGGDELLFWGSKWLSVFQDAISDAVDSDKLSRLADSYLRLLRRIAPTADKVTDKMTENYMRLGAIHLVFPQAKLINCRRLPVDNCLSIYMNNFRDPPHFVYDRDDVVFAYGQYTRLMDHWREVLPPDRFMDVDYEHLVADQEGVARRVIEFCGLEWDDACLRHEENERSIKTASVWQARQPVYKTSVERWRRYEPWLGAFRKLLPDQEAQ